MNVNQIIRAAIPDASDACCAFVLWGRTAFPFTKLTAKDLFKAASGYKRSVDNGNKLCELCDRIATDNHCICETCRSALNAPNIRTKEHS